MEPAGPIYGRADQTDATGVGETKTKIRKLCCAMPQVAVDLTHLPGLIMSFNDDQKSGASAHSSRNAQPYLLFILDDGNCFCILHFILF
ncbi:hypothetical protein PT2222_130111 [Paraburkholderia tropica]